MFITYFKYKLYINKNNINVLNSEITGLSQFIYSSYNSLINYEVNNDINIITISSRININYNSLISNDNAIFSFVNSISGRRNNYMYKFITSLSGDLSNNKYNFLQSNDLIIYDNFNTYIYKLPDCVYCNNVMQGAFNSYL